MEREREGGGGSKGASQYHTKPGITTEFLPVFLVGAEDVLDQQLVLGESLPGDGHEFCESESMATTHLVHFRILQNTVCMRVCVVSFIITRIACGIRY